MNKMILCIGLALSCQIAVGMDKPVIQLGLQNGDDQYALEIREEGRGEKDLFIGNLEKTEDKAFAVSLSHDQIQMKSLFKVIASTTKGQGRSIPQAVINQEFRKQCEQVGGSTVFILKPITDSLLSTRDSSTAVAPSPKKILIQQDKINTFFQATEEAEQIIEKSEPTNFSWRSLLFSRYGLTGVISLAGFCTLIYFNFLRK